MNIFLFLRPKSEVAYLTDDMSIRQALEKMEYHRYASIPVLDNNGRYKRSLSEGDILWFIKNNADLNLKNAEDIPISKVESHRYCKPMHAECQMEDLIAKVREQNFVPIIVADGIFIGIVTRKDIIDYLYSKVDNIE